MEPALRVVLAWLVFALTHFGLSALPVRRRLVARLGEWGFVGVFAGIAALNWALVIVSYSLQAQSGAAGPALGSLAAARWLLVSASVLGVVLMTAAFAGYSSSPYALAGRQARSAHGLARVTRHPFFAGVALFGAAHALLATKLVGSAAMGGLAAIAIIGIGLQDRKLIALRGESYEDYLRVTSSWPFAAILARRQRWVPRELPFGHFALGLALAFVLRALHSQLFAGGGIFVVAAVLGGVSLILVSEWRRVHVARPARSAGG